ncbi:MAG: hypothetical protein C5B49_09075 [Bdellovibrio sp.]|nr:MAG: hypothetical protein C5B49_09075 [Bdellovibrio sp.]
MPRLGSFLMSICIGCLFLCFPELTHAQVRLFLVSDVHSDPEFIVRSAPQIDVLAQRFLRENPFGQIVVLVLGDFTSVTPYTRRGFGSHFLQVLHFFSRWRDYTVLFVPGNHDALDWAIEREIGPDLFLRQMDDFHGWGVHVLAANMNGKVEDVQRTVQPSYDLVGARGTRVLGLALEQLVSRSNLSQRMADNMFTIHSYETALQQQLVRAYADGVKNLVLAVHDGFDVVSTLGAQVKRVAQSRGINIAVVAAADDHDVHTINADGTLYLDAGSKGRFTMADLREDGTYLSKSAIHYGIPGDHEKRIEEGVELELVTATSGVPHVMLGELARRWDSWQQDTKTQLDRVLGFTKKGFQATKKALMDGPNDLGSLFAETLSHWTRNQPWYDSSVPVVSFFNSSSYSYEKPIPRGPISELLLRTVIPHIDAAAVYQVSGRELKELYFSLRDAHPGCKKKGFTPQTSFNFRYRNKKIEIFHSSRWQEVEDDGQYFLAVDGFLARHQDGGAWRIEEWVKIFNSRLPQGEVIFQDLLVDTFPGIVSLFEEGKLGFTVQREVQRRAVLAKWASRGEEKKTKFVRGSSSRRCESVNAGLF